MKFRYFYCIIYYDRFESKIIELPSPLMLKQLSRDGSIFTNPNVHGLLNDPFRQVTILPSG